MKDDQADLAQLMPAPDFVGGGSILYDAAEMQNVLEKGRGTTCRICKTDMDQAVKIYYNRVRKEGKR